MFVMQTAAALMMLQAAPPAMIDRIGTADIVQDAGTMQRDAAYDELARGETDAAIARLEAGLIDNPNDPALLINLGSAWAARGDKDKATRYYLAAAQSDVRYRLELANGEWLDSRSAARLALRTLQQSAVAMN